MAVPPEFTAAGGGTYFQAVEINAGPLGVKEGERFTASLPEVEDGVSNSFAAHLLVLSLAADYGVLLQTALLPQAESSAGA